MAPDWPERIWQQRDRGRQKRAPVSFWERELYALQKAVGARKSSFSDKAAYLMRRNGTASLGSELESGETNIIVAYSALRVYGGRARQPVCAR